MKLGIDLGTYNSAAAYVVPGQREIEQVVSRSGANPSGKQFPSFVKFDALGAVEYTGEPARNMRDSSPRLVVWGAKRLIGRPYSEARQEMRRFAYSIECGPNDTILIPQGAEKYTPERILQIILQRIKEDAENPALNPLLAGQTIDEAVITAPAYYDAFKYNNYIKEAATAAAVGFRQVKIIPEPVAAATRYGLQLNGSERILAFDLGAGTLDVTVLRVRSQGGQWFAEDTITSGNPEFGGIDIDDLLLEDLNLDHAIANQPIALARIRDSVEKAKIDLTEYSEASVHLPGGRSIRFTRDAVSELVTPFLEEKCDGPIHVALHPNDQSIGPLIDHVLLIGGPTRMHCVREYLIGRLRKNGVREDVLRRIPLDPNAPGMINPMDCVSEGAAAITGHEEPRRAATSLPGPATASLVIVRDPYGYGTRAGNGYLEIIAPNSACPVSGLVDLRRHQSNQDFLFVVPLYSRVPNTDLNKRDAQPYRWTYLGDFKLAIVPDGKDQIIRVKVELDLDRSATVTLQRMYAAGDHSVLTESSPTTHRKGEHRIYYGLEHIKRMEVSPLHEAHGDADDGDGGRGRMPPPELFPPAPPNVLSPQKIGTIAVMVRQALDRCVRSALDQPESRRKPEFTNIEANYSQVKDMVTELGRQKDMITAIYLINETVSLLSRLSKLDIPNHQEVDMAIKELEDVLSG